MKCARCGGFMMVESLSNGKQGSVRLAMIGTRCLNCGNVEDSIICRNRAERPSLRHAPRGGSVEQGGMNIG